MSPTLEKKILRLAYASLDLIKSKRIHFSFIVQRTTIVAFGYNKIYKSHPIANRFTHRFNDIHSELSAIIDFQYHLSELAQYQFVNLRIRRDTGKQGYSRPCRCCTNMLMFFGVSKVLYSTDKGWFDEIF